MITPTETGIIIDGKYYTVVGGYQSTKQGQFYIEYKNLLSVKRIRRRSKKIFFSFILFGSMWISVPPLFDMVRRAISFFGGVELENKVVQIAIILSAISLLLLFFSNRTYIEFSFIGGVVRVPCSFMRKTDDLNLIADIQKRKSKIL